MVLFSAGFATANAQSVIKELAIPIGTHRYFYTDSFVNPNPVVPDSNVSWDFRKIAYNMSDSVSFRLMDSTPFSSQFSNCNMILNEHHYKTQRNILWHFNKDSTGMDFKGYGEVGLGSSVYSGNKRKLRFPFVFNTSYKDTYSVSGVTYYSEVKYDGNGYLYLPKVGYYMVYRISSKDSASPTDIKYYYDWITRYHRVMFMEIGNGYSHTYYLRYPAAVSGLTSAQDELVSVIPNPGKGKFKLQLPAGSDLTKMKIFDMLGREIAFNYNAELSEFEISAPGHYTLMLQCGANIFYRQLLTE